MATRRGVTVAECRLVVALSRKGVQRRRAQAIRFSRAL